MTAVRIEGGIDPWEAKAAARQFGKLLHARRRELGLSQGKVAAAAGMDKRHYQELEHGFSNSRTGSPANPRLVTLLCLARALALDPQELVRVAAKGADSVYLSREDS